MSFSLDISKFVKKAQGNTDKVVRKVIIDLGTGIIKKNPVGDPDLWQSKPPAGYVGGRSRANWQYGNNLMPAGSIDSTDPSGGKTIAAITAGVKTAPTAAIHWIANSLPYITRLEDGHSKQQAPFGMVKLTVKEFQSIVKGAVNGVRR